MSDSRICRDYQSGDEHRILTLYKEVTGRDMDLGYWRWRFAESPFGKGIIKLMFDNEKLIGHYAVVPTDLQVRGRIVKAAFSLNTMTHPDYERQGVFTYLAGRVYEKCRREGIGIVYGFPNSNSHYGFTRKLGWTGFGKMDTWRKNLGTTTDIAKTENTHEIDRFDDKVDLLWARVRANYELIILRTQGFLNWRYTVCPTRAYTKYIILDNQSAMLGYIVLKTYTGRGKPEGHIVDMLCVQDEDIACSLLACAYKYFSKNKIQDLSCWIPDDCFCASVLMDEGFVSSESATNFGIRIFDKSVQGSGQIDNWYLTMGDSDVF